MRYSWEKVNTRHACDALLVQAQVKKQRLERRRRNLGESIGVFRRRLNGVSQEQMEVHSALVVFTTAHNALPDGRDKVAIRIKIKRLEVRLAVLEKKAYTHNAVALLAREMKYNLLDRQLWAMERYIAAVKRISQALGRPGMRLVPPAAYLRAAVGRGEQNRQGVPKGYAERLPPGVSSAGAVGLLFFLYFCGITGCLAAA